MRRLPLLPMWMGVDGHIVAMPKHGMLVYLYSEIPPGIMLSSVRTSLSYPSGYHGLIRLGVVVSSVRAS